MGTHLVSADAVNKLQDLSGIAILPGQNPYNALITACNDSSTEIQALYHAHRVKRNEQQKQKFMAPGFEKLVIDRILLRLENPELEPGFRDPRNCFVIWARPPEHIVRLAAHVQALLKKAAPSVWLMPQHRMHLTALEATHSKTPEEIIAFTDAIRPVIPYITDYTYSHRARLVKPMVSYDLSAFALSFLTAAGEPPLGPPPAATAAQKAVVEGDGYTYHHLRRDIFDLARSTGVSIESRYQVPSAHITLGRYITEEDHATPEARARWVATIDAVNAWLEGEVWDLEDGEWVGEWVVGQEKGLEARNGQLWYGGGRTIRAGEGF
ncbi:RNA ligase/cyclic nucleotide phosphodiesterase [Colletotrichum navitas]|uniref:RNA ligase/cyclic nucleotide phosphodiesterase n=1 Tax=Colletotrichum navitas TaxID=681940 RepID=A0AAD8V1T3_9PEZI|nr:RNA ligase/cyclic nucleotide phosphodiesterase [Colletotrichum navitas]KAK1574680.1 RNA ligase/cyclic nucleotide phosphodiesterase [Colletotrichum navitas]